MTLTSREYLWTVSSLRLGAAAGRDLAATGRAGASPKQKLSFTYIG